MNRPVISPTFSLLSFLVFVGSILVLGDGTRARGAYFAAKDDPVDLAEVKEDLDAGRILEAKKSLESIPKPQRSFEYEYLLARIKAAPPKGPAPDLIRTVEVPKVETRYGVLNPVDRQLAFLCRDGSVRVHDLRSPKEPPKTLNHEGGGALWSGAFSHDGKTFAAGFESGEVLIWDTKTWKVRTSWSLGEKWPVRELALAPDGSSVVAESKTALELWSIAAGVPKKVATVGERYNFGEGLAFSPTGDRIATGGMFDIVLYDAKTGQKQKSLRHASYTMGLEFSPDGKFLASAPRGNVNKLLALYDIAQSKQIFNAGPLDRYIAGLAFTPDGKRVIATGPDHSVRLFHTTTGEVVFNLGRPEATAKPAITHDGKLLGWSEPSGYRFIDLGGEK